MLVLRGLGVDKQIRDGCTVVKEVIIMVNSR